MKYLLDFCLISISFTLFLMEHKWSDKRTKKYKRLRIFFIVLFIIFATTTFYTTYSGSKKINDLQIEITEINNKNSKLINDFTPFIAKWADLDKDDPRVTDGAIILLVLKLVENAKYEGVIFDMRYEGSSANRIRLNIFGSNLLRLTFCDYKGKEYSTKGHIEFDVSKPIKIEVMWSFKYNFIAIRFNDKIIASSQIPDTKLDLSSTANYNVHLFGFEAPLFLQKFNVYTEKSNRFKLFDMTDFTKQRSQ